MVDLVFNPQVTTAWDKLAQRQFHAEIGIDVGGTVISAPITEPSQTSFTSFGDRVAISGDLTATTARNLATALRFGALPVPLELVQTRTICTGSGHRPFHRTGRSDRTPRSDAGHLPGTPT